MTSVPMVHVYCTDFGEVRLTDRFVAEADHRWPDKRCTRIPRWVGEIHGPMTQLVMAGLAHRAPVRVVKSIAALGFR